MEIDHLTVFVRNYEASKPFYEEVLAPLGLVILLDWPDAAAGRLRPAGAELALADRIGRCGQTGDRSPGTRRRRRPLVLRHGDCGGGRSDLEPGIRHEYNRDYYSARVFDFDGNSLEAVFRGAVARRPLRGSNLLSAMDNLAESPR
jgi:catechol 2,3-dioxygenase-like lactoylglutathione lyase family enzyme